MAQCNQEVQHAGLCPAPRQLQFRDFDLFMIKHDATGARPCIHRAPLLQVTSPWSGYLPSWISFRTPTWRSTTSFSSSLQASVSPCKSQRHSLWRTRTRTSCCQLERQGPRQSSCHCEAELDWTLASLSWTLPTSSTTSTVSTLSARRTRTQRGGRPQHCGPHGGSGRVLRRHHHQ